MNVAFFLNLFIYFLSPDLSAYGTVVELRINTKGVGGKLPNFGFVVFDDSEPVQRILGAKVEGACINISLPTSFGGGFWWHALLHFIWC